MKISFDPKADALRITLQEGAYATSEEVADGVILDRTQKGQLLAIEILDVSERMPNATLKNITLGNSS
jgi:uncharacterized protein YuzE